MQLVAKNRHTQRPVRNGARLIKRTVAYAHVRNDKASLLYNHAVII